MPTVTKSIGTASRDYSTITAWEADLDNGAIYSSGDTAQGEGYNDSEFDEVVNINGGSTVGLTKITLTVASGHRHTGTAGTGCRIVRSATSNEIVQWGSSNSSRDFAWWEIDNNGYRGQAVLNSFMSGGGQVGNFSRLILHGMVYVLAFDQYYVYLTNSFGSGSFINSIIYSVAHDNTGSYTVNGINAQSNWPCYNITVHNVSKAGSSGVANCIAAASTNKNCIAMSPSGGASTACFTGAGARSYDMSSDATATGTGSLTNKTASNQFVSITAGFEDLHLKSGADAIDAGTDLGTTPTNVQFDIDNYDRDTTGVTWDMGADEYVAAAAAVTRHPMLLGVG